MQVHIYEYVCVETGGQPQGSTSGYQPLLRNCLSLAQTHQLGWPGTTCLCLPSARVTDMPVYLGFLSEFRGIELSFLSLQDKHGNVINK